MKILVVEDEIELCEAIAEGLSLEGYAVDKCYDGQEALYLMINENYDLVILDLNLPSMDGLEVLKEVRKEKRDLKIIILSARETVKDKVAGLDLGANDYLGKPFSFEELEARIRNLMRRDFKQLETKLVWKDLEIDTNLRRLYINNKEVTLTKKEYAIIEYLMFHPDHVISAEELLDHVWDSDADLFSNSIRVHIASLRKKINLHLDYEPIQTKIAEGYFLWKD